MNERNFFYLHSVNVKLLYLYTGNSASVLNTDTKFPPAIIESESHSYIQSLLYHILKILSIFHHVFTNQRPIFIPKGQKADLFINAKEAHQLNSFGYFGNDYFYLKMYKFVKVSYDNYKVGRWISSFKLK